MSNILKIFEAATIALNSMVYLALSSLERRNYG